MLVSRGHMEGRAGVQGPVAHSKQLPAQLTPYLHLTPVTDPAWHLLQLLLLAFHLAGMQACLGLFLEGLSLVAPFSCPMLGQAGVCLSAQGVSR